MIGNILGSVLSAGLNFFGGERANEANKDIVGNQLNFQEESQKRSMDFGREMVGRQEDFQRESVANQEDFQRETLNSAMAYNRDMSGTAYQRGMADMKAAGLNPILAYSQGGATAPQVSGMSGANAPGASSSVGTLGGASAVMQNTLGPAVGSALQGMRAITELEQLTENVSRTKAETQLLGTQQAQVETNTALQTAQTINEGIRKGQITADIERLRSQAQANVASARQAHSSATINDQEAQRFRDYGPRGAIPDTIASGEAMGRRALNSAPAIGRAVERAAEAVAPSGAPAQPRNYDTEPNPVRDFIRRLRRHLQ